MRSRLKKHGSFSSFGWRYTIQSTLAFVRCASILFPGHCLDLIAASTMKHQSCIILGIIIFLILATAAILSIVAASYCIAIPEHPLCHRRSASPTNSSQTTNSTQQKTAQQKEAMHDALSSTVVLQVSMLGHFKVGSLDATNHSYWITIS